MPNWELVHTPGKMPQTPLFKILGVQNSSIGDLEIVSQSLSHFTEDTNKNDIRNEGSTSDIKY